jgi:hypothetical protein
VTGLSGNVNFNIDLCGVIQHQCNSLGWGFGKEFVPPGGDDPLSGTFFALGNDPFIFRATTVSRGQLAMIYSGGAITNFFDDGSGWQQIGASFSPPSDWTPSSVPLTLQLSADIHVVTSVPEPESYAMLLAGLGLLGFGARRRKQNAA